MARRVSLLGDSSAASLLRAAGLEVRCNAPPDGGDIVLVSVSARDGVLAATLDAIDLAAGTEAGHLGFLLTEVGACGDAELVELMTYELPDLLGSKCVIPFAECGRLPVFRSDDPSVGQAV